MSIAPKFLKQSMPNVKGKKVSKKKPYKKPNKKK
jgi:hypothetical protein